MFDSNLSKIKPKLRTSGAVSWPRRKAGSPLREIGETNRETVRISPRSEYVDRMIYVLETTTDGALRKFAYSELHRLNYFQERRIVPGRTAQPFKGPIGAS